MEKKKVIAIIGPTAVGKTKVSIELAERFNGEIISGDSMQIYKGMDIGTAKVTKDEAKGIPHHLIDWKEPHESFTVFDFKEVVNELITSITERGKLPILVGGTGLYLQAVLYDYQFPDVRADLNLRSKLEARLEQEGPMPLFQELERIDPESTLKIHPNNTKRVVRALEVYYTTGKKFSDQTLSQQFTPLYDSVVIGLTMERSLLYDRINKRVFEMMEQGLEQEVRTFYNLGLENAQSMQAIGYKEFVNYFEGKSTLEQTVELIQQNSRRYAKRQLTWFKNKMDLDWFDMTEITAFEKKVEEISAFVAGTLRIKANR